MGLWRIRSCRIGNPRRQGARLRRQCERHHIRRAFGRGYRGIPGFRQDAGCRRLDVARICLRAGARPGTFYEPPQNQGAVSQRIRSWQGQGLEPYAFRPLPRFSRRQPELPLYALGHADAEYFRMAEALLPARRGLCELVRRIDENDGLGCVWHRPLRKMRKLHGPLRLRADGSSHYSGTPDRSNTGCTAWSEDRRRDGTGNITRSATPRAVRVFTPRPEDAGAYRGAQGSGQGNGDSELAIVAPPNYRGRGRITSAPAWGAESVIA